MPPALSDDEMDSDEYVDMVPAKAAPAPVDEADDEDEEDDEDEPDEYRVEKILRHDFGAEGTVLYQIKWLGYDKKSDLTWEPVENLENALDILKEYHASIGGPPQASAPAKKKGPKPGSKRSSAAANLDSPEISTKKSKRKSDFSNGTPAATTDKKLPEGSWEGLVTVSSILEENAANVKGSKHKSGLVLMALLVWDEDGKKTQHPLETARYKCPQKLLDYYERHLVFKSNNLEDEEGDVIQEEQ